MAVLLSLFLGYLGLTIGMKRKEDVLSFLNFSLNFVIEETRQIRPKKGTRTRMARLAVPKSQ